MSQIIDLFGLETSTNTNPYRSIGYPRNPFRENESEQLQVSGAFYKEYIQEQLTEINNWVNDVHNKGIRQPLSVVGNIGSEKTRILRFIERRLRAMRPSEGIMCEWLLLSQTGYSRASIGGLLITMLQNMRMPNNEPVPENVLPLIWAIVNQSNDIPQGKHLSTTLRRIQQSKSKVELSRVFSGWLQRMPLTSKQSSDLGLYQRIDWEGELISEISEIIRIAGQVGVIKTVFVFIDQFEDLFTPNFSELRRSRILTDLRGLVDEIDAGTPMGLLLSWSPDFTQYARGVVDTQFRLKYEALYSRMDRKRVSLPLLSVSDAVPFAREWIETLDDDDDDFVLEEQPRITELVTVVWEELKRNKSLYPGEVVTPRELLAALAREVDRRVGGAP